MARNRKLSPEDRDIAAALLRRRRRVDRGEVPPSAADPALGRWETTDEARRVEDIVAAVRQGDATALAALRKLAESSPSTPSDPIRRALAQIERQDRRKGALAVAEKKRTSAGYATPEVVREVVDEVDRREPTTRRRYGAYREELSRRGEKFPLNDFARWVRRSLENSQH